MHFQIVDTRSAYRRMLAAADDERRAAVFRDELYAPFAGLVRLFGGDGPAAFAQWGMRPEQFGPDEAPRWRAALEALAGQRAWERAAAALERGWASFAAYAGRIPPRQIVFGLMLADMRHVPFQRGYTGFGGIPGWIMTVYDQPDAYNLARIEAVTVHELHHNLLGAAFPDRPMIADVGSYIVGEGLAESFAAELYGEELTGQWAHMLEGDELEQARRVIGGALERSGFDVVRRYIFGDTMAGFGGYSAAGGERVPDFAGYTVGYQVVQRYLRRSGKRVAEATFVPAREIIAESGYFAGL